MTTTAFRRIAFGAAPAMLVVGALAGCNNDSAPAVQAPATSATTAAASDSGVPTASSTGQSTDQPVPTDTGVPTVSAAPSSSSAATGDPAKVCTEDDSFLTPGALAPSTKKAKWGQPLALSQKYGGTVTVTPEVPKAKKPSGNDDIFGPPKGQVSLLIKVTVKYKSGDESSIAGVYFTLRDTKKNVCNYASLSQAVPKQDQFDDGDVSKTTKSYSGTLVYEVPANQDYKKYTLLYRADNYDDKSADAPVAWTN